MWKSWIQIGRLALESYVPYAEVDDLKGITL